MYKNEALCHRTNAKKVSSELHLTACNCCDSHANETRFRRVLTQKIFTWAEETTRKEEHSCTNVAKCAQCDGEHHSLYSQCHVIQQYRADLKEDVTKALESSKFHRKVYSKQQPGFNIRDQDFSPLDEAKRPQQQVA